MEVVATVYIGGERHRISALRRTEIKGTQDRSNSKTG